MVTVCDDIEFFSLQIVMDRNLIKMLLKRYPTKDMIKDETESEFRAKKRFTHNSHQFNDGID